MPSASVGQIWNYTTPGTYSFTVPESGLYNLKCCGAQGCGGASVLDNWEIVSANYNYYYHWYYGNYRYNSTFSEYHGTTFDSYGTRYYYDSSSFVSYNYAWIQHNAGSLPGLGGTVSGDIYLKKGEVLNIYVGGQGTYASSLNTGGGYNGGGHGGPGGGGGGGATDIRYKNATLQSRFIVAGGGGGADDYGTSRNNQNDFNKSGVFNSQGDGSGGAGGGLISKGSKCDGNIYSQYAATQTSGYAPGQGQNVTVNTDCGGGGGGYYGGYTGNAASYGGAGGSSYLAPVFKNTTNTQGDNSGNGSAAITLLKLFNFQHYVLKVKDKEEYYIISDDLKQTGYYTPVTRDYLFDISNINNHYTNTLGDTFKNGIPEQLRNKSLQIMKIQGYRNIEYNNQYDNVPVPDNFGYGIYKYNGDIKNVDLYKTANIQMQFRQFLNTIKKSVIKLVNNLTILLDSYIPSFTLNSDDITFALKDRDIIYGKNFDIINQDEIYEKGFTRNDLINLKDVPLNNFNVLMVFNKVYTTNKLSIVKIINTIPALKDKINEIDYNIFFDKENKKAFIKFGKDYNSSVYLNKISTTVEKHDSINSMKEF